ncbi:helix-turn-helix domain-containing protein [uncultured Methylobacterium sp.]|uniref:helix-turn-helix domain-containing protein n=1 Tax=uncultured Methylobacterium sp. TaxID=157278 RepID=UPI0035CBB143
MRADAKALKARLMGEAPARSSAPIARPAPVPQPVFVTPEAAPPAIDPAEAERQAMQAWAREYEGTPAMSRHARTRFIIRTIAVHHGVTVEEVEGEGRRAKVVRPRQLAMVALWLEISSMSLPSVGRLLNRDHTTVLHALRKFGASATRTWPADLIWLRVLLRDKEAALRGRGHSISGEDWAGEGCA